MPIPPEALDPAKISQLITAEENPGRCRDFAPETAALIWRYGSIIGCEVEQHRQLPRGMDRARQCIDQAAARGNSIASGTIIIADQMAGSRGRFHRSWYAPTGGLWLTIIIANTLLPEFSRLLPLAIGIGCCETIRHFDIPAAAKWVNDVHLNNRKLSGVLIETMVLPQTAEEFFLVGVGINVNNTEFPPELADTATAMCTCLGQDLDLGEVTGRLFAKLRWNLGLLLYDEAQFLAEKDSGTPTRLAPHLLASFTNLTDSLARRVRFGFDIQQQTQYTATTLGLDHTGGLTMQLDDGSIITEYSGEIAYCD